PGDTVARPSRGQRAAAARRRAEQRRGEPLLGGAVRAPAGLPGRVRGVRRRLLRRRARRGPRRAAAVHRRAARRRRHRERAARGGHRWLGGRTRLAVVPPTQHGFNPLLPPPGVSPRFRPLEGEHMTEPRLPVTLFTGQWADMPFEELAEKAAAWGYDGLEIAASGDHLDLKRSEERRVGKGCRQRQVAL